MVFRRRYFITRAALRQALDGFMSYFAAALDGAAVAQGRFSLTSSSGPE